MGEFDAGKTLNYKLKDPRNGVYTFVLEGDVTVAGQALNQRDGFGVWDTASVDIKANSHTKILMMEVPMALR